MDNGNLDFALVTMNSALMKRQAADKILACNENTQKYGLILNEHV